MKTLTLILARAIAAPAFVACERTIETQTKVKKEDGRTTVEKKTVTESPDSQVTETKERHEVNNR